MLRGDLGNHGGIVCDWCLQLVVVVVVLRVSWSLGGDVESSSAGGRGSLKNWNERKLGLQ